MDTTKYYAFNFAGKDFFTERELVRTYLPIGQLSLPELLDTAKEYEKGLTFRPIYGLIKEVMWKDNGTPGINSPSRVGGEKFQAFIFKRSGDTITGDGTNYYVNGEKVDLEFGGYSVEIVEV